MKFLVTVVVGLALVAPAHAQLAPLNDAGMTFGHIHLNVSDVERHKAFWVEHFGGEVVQRGSLTAIKWPSMLVLLTNRAPTGGSQGTVMDHLGFKVRDVAAVLAKWRAAGYEVQQEFTGAEGFPNAYLMGPDSVRIELQEDKTMTEDVVGYHVHWFTPEYRETLDWYVNMFGQFGLERFQRGSIATTANTPGMNLSFGTANGPREPSRGRSIDHIGFEFRDLDAAVRALEAKGLTLDSPVREVANLGLKIAFFTDPSGVYVELTQGLVDF
jgi:catechol 2,3-dioxygenase-like lactoylglutathione lyase family enzyme